ncbi:MAG: type IV secretion system DotC family protein [Deltaproteobacteria bacterium]|jgi:defect-in-organelle-trafficking protein DotC|nr:type IV secretion system DotC family protein [Deltaproteobacteria bacterium]
MTGRAKKSGDGLRGPLAGAARRPAPAGPTAAARRPKGLAQVGWMCLLAAGLGFWASGRAAWAAGSARSQGVQVSQAAQAAEAVHGVHGVHGVQGFQGVQAAEAVQTVQAVQAGQAARPARPAPAGPQAVAVPPELARLRALRSGGAAAPESAAAAGLRARIQRETALAAAVQAGARWRYARILAEVVRPRAADLDVLFDFRPFLETRGELFVVPPAASASGEAYRLLSPAEAGAQSGGFSLIQGAYLTSSPPCWRSYLLASPPGPEAIHPGLRPGDGREAAAWRRWVDEGWRLGAAQAEGLFAANVARLARDLTGMARFGRLVRERLAQGAEVGTWTTGLEVRTKEIVFDKTLYRLLEEGRFVEPSEPPEAGRRPGARPNKRRP